MREVHRELKIEWPYYDALCTCLDISFQLSGETYRIVEAPSGAMQVVIEKMDRNILLANPITFMVQPLTVDQALAQGVIAEFELLDPFSPNRAGEG